MERFDFSNVMHAEVADRMANIVDPDQTALLEQSDLDLHCLLRLSVPLFVI